MIDNWIADRVRAIEIGRVRKIMELGASLKDPVNLSIGQPHFPVPDAVKTAACQAIQQNRNGYTRRPGDSGSAEQDSGRGAPAVFPISRSGRPSSPAAPAAAWSWP